jgi:hypothetical protein
MKDRNGKLIEPGDKVQVRWHPNGSANGTNTGVGVFEEEDQYGGFLINFDQPMTHYSKFSGVTDRRRHYICSLSQGGTYYLDGFPCRREGEWIELISKKDQETT